MATSPGRQRQRTVCSGCTTWACSSRRVSTGYGENVYEGFGRPIEDRREVNTRAVGRLRAVLQGERLNAPGDVLEPPEPELAERIWQGVFSEEGSRHAARAGSHLLLNRAAYGYEEPTSCSDPGRTPSCRMAGPAPGPHRDLPAHLPGRGPSPGAGPAGTGSPVVG